MSNRVYVRFPVQSRQILAVLNRDHPRTMVIFGADGRGTCVLRNRTTMTMANLMVYYGWRGKK